MTFTAFLYAAIGLTAVVIRVMEAWHLVRPRSSGVISLWLPLDGSIVILDEAGKYRGRRVFHLPPMNVGFRLAPCGSYGQCFVCGQWGELAYVDLVCSPNPRDPRRPLHESDRYLCRCIDRSLDKRRRICYKSSDG